MTTDATDPAGASAAGAHKKSGVAPLAIGSLGVVFGDIGTSPLYAFKEALGQAAEGGVTRPEVFGIVSLAIWALLIVVTVKYVIFMMRADNNGEGGVLSLMALAQQALGKRTTVVLILGMCGAALFYGDAVITPAISVLSAVEGLKTIPSLEAYVTPAIILMITIGVLVALFMVQSSGTGKVAKFFGPICLVWFGVLAALGLMHLVREPEVLQAISPTYAVSFMAHHGASGLLVMGSVFLTVTGAEALYADMGHFGRWPIQAAWAFIVLPALALNYLGQGALVLETLRHAGNAPFENLDWFFLLAPTALRPPLVILACVATVIASQAVITGAFSLSQQAIQLGLLPRMNIQRTSETHVGQIYLPQINLLLLIAVILLVGVFKTSSGLAQAYGLAVTGTMVVTTSLALIVVRRRWGWNRLATAALIGPLLAVDLVFLGANALKILSGGWLPLVIGGALLAVMVTWVRGTDLLREKTRNESLPLIEFIGALNRKRLIKVSGTAVFLASDPEITPGAFLHNLKHNAVLHEKNVILCVRIAETPRVDDADRIRVEKLSDDFARAWVTFGFIERPSIPKAMALLRQRGMPFDIMKTSFFLGRRSLTLSASSPLPRWQERLFILLMRNSASPTDFFQIPPGRVVEMGAQTAI
jgi:KUP system potassium uptake protein